MASIRNRNGRWHVQIRRKGTPSINNTFSLKSDALYWAREQERLIEQGSFLKPDTELLNHTFQALLKRYEYEIAHTKRSYSVERYYFGYLQRLPFAKQPLKSLNVQDIQKWINERAITHKASSTNRIAGIISRVFAIAMRNWGYPLGHNPMERVIKPTERNRAIHRIHPDIVSKLQKPTSRIEWVALFALETAMRRGEIAHLRWEDIRMNEQLAFITDAKNGESRHIPLSFLALSAIKQGDSNNSRVFGMSSNAIRLAWDRYRKKENMREVRFHDLRHEAISMLFEKGLSVPEVALISGHKTTSQLFRYAHADIRTLKQKLNFN